MIDPLMLMLGWGKINTIQDGGNAQNAQVQLTAAQTRDNSPVLGLHGVISNAPDGSDAVWLAPGGDASRAVVIGTNHQPSRFKNAPRGAGGSYDQVGSHIIFTNDTNGKIVLSGTFTIQIGSMTAVFAESAITFTIGGTTYTFTAATLAAMGAAITATGEITAKAGGAFVNLSTHKGHGPGVAPPTPGT